MTFDEAIKELEALKNDRVISYYKKNYGNDGKYYGLGLTKLKKLAKKIKTDPILAKQLLSSEYFEAKILSFMVDDPKLYNKQTLIDLIKKLPEQYSESPLSYFVMVLTEFIASKSPDVKEVVITLTKSKNDTHRFIGYSTLNNLGKNKKIEDNYFYQFLTLIEANIQSEVNNVKDAMYNSLLSWGQRSKELNGKIIKSFKTIGEVVVDYGDTSCKTPDVHKILISDRIQNKLI